jgi:hypothetical protein
MTKKKKFKRKIRNLVKAEGRPYTALLAENARPVDPVASRVPGTPKSAESQQQTLTPAATHAAALEEWNRPLSSSAVESVPVPEQRISPEQLRQALASLKDFDATGQDRAWHELNCPLSYWDPDSSEPRPECECLGIDLSLPLLDGDDHYD